MIIDGKKMASVILDRLKLETQKLKEKGIKPTLAVVLMGDDKSSVAYIKQKKLKAEEIGAQVKVFKFSKDITNEEIETLLVRLDRDPRIHGIILQRPAPEHIEIDRLEELISPEKEVDGFGSHPLYPIPVAEAVYRIILSVIPENRLESKKIAVIGKGETAGKPVIDYLIKREINPDIIDSKTENREELLKNADLIISAVGNKVLNPQDIKKGATLIGIGLHTNTDGKLKGDYEDSEIEQVANFYSPTPGGVGPVNVAVLMENLIKAAKLSPEA